MPVSLQNWKWKSFSVGHARSGELKEVDTRVTACQNANSLPNLKELAKAILKWQRLKGPGTQWTTSRRADEMLELINLVKAAAALLGNQSIFGHVHCEPRATHLALHPGVFLNTNTLAIAGAGDGLKHFKLAYIHTDTTYNQGPSAFPMPAPMPHFYSLGLPNHGPVLDVDCVTIHRDVTNAFNAGQVQAKFHPVTAANIVTTGQLTGCTFLMRVHAGNLECTHIGPDQFANGAALHTFLDGLGMAGVTSFGRNDYPDSASIIGFRQGGNWRIYAQKYTNITKVTSAVEQIYP